jgi:hypothetical protein
MIGVFILCLSHFGLLGRLSHVGNEMSGGLLLFQPEKQIARERRQGDLVVTALVGQAARWATAGGEWNAALNGRRKWGKGKTV